MTFKHCASRAWSFLSNISVESASAPEQDRSEWNHRSTCPLCLPERESGSRASAALASCEFDAYIGLVNDRVYQFDDHRRLTRSALNTGQEGEDRGAHGQHIVTATSYHLRHDHDVSCRRQDVGCRAWPHRLDC